MTTGALIRDAIELHALKRRGSPAVLVVDDDPVAVRLLTVLFTGFGINVHAAKDGAQALLMHRKHRYRLVVADWMMPRMSGTELCRAIRSQGDRYVYFVLSSALSQREDRFEAYDAGVDDFFSKPIDAIEMQGRLIVADRILTMHDSLQVQAQELRDTRDKLVLLNEGLTAASNRFCELFNDLPIPCFTFSADGLIQEWNRFAERSLGLEAYQVVQREIWNVLGESSDGFWSRSLVARLFLGQSVHECDWTLRTREGIKRHYSANILPFEDGHGQIVGAICACADMTDRLAAKMISDREMADIRAIAVQLSSQKRVLEVQNDELAKQAFTDGLTGLWNHRKFREELRAAFVESKASGSPVSVLLADVDQFKLFNDKFGHLAGDDALKRIAAILLREALPGEQPARYGGEEFAILLPGIDATRAATRAESFRAAVAAELWELRQITISLGVAANTSATTTPQQILERADVALYQAKADGRNCVRQSDDAKKLPRRRRSDKNAA